MAAFIILDRPKRTHIPYFAMGIPWSFENTLSHLVIDSDLTKIVGRRCSDWLSANKGDDSIKLLSTRNYIAPREAFYLHWLHINEDSLAERFLNAFPKYRLEQRIEKLRLEREALEEKVEQRINRKGYDLFQIAADQRWIVAKRFVEAQDEINDLRRYQRDLETAAPLVAEWCAKL